MRLLAGILGLAMAGCGSGGEQAGLFNGADTDGGPRAAITEAGGSAGAELGAGGAGSAPVAAGGSAAIAPDAGPPPSAGCLSDADCHLGDRCAREPKAKTSSCLAPCSDTLACADTTAECAYVVGGYLVTKCVGQTISPLPPRACARSGAVSEPSACS